jgi:hypothetical protein
VRDHLLHLLGGITIGALYVYLPTAAVGGTLGGLYGFIREWVQMSRTYDRSFGSRRSLETITWAVGGALPGLIIDILGR